MGAGGNGGKFGTAFPLRCGSFFALALRLHPELQKAVLESLYQQVGFARSLLAYELPDGHLKLIDDHLRRDLDPDMLVEVEILDVTEEEARVLLRSIDPLAALAETQKQLQLRLLELAPPVSPEMEAAWLAAAQAGMAAEPNSVGPLPGPALFLILVTCRDENQQVELVTRFGSEGLPSGMRVGVSDRRAQASTSGPGQGTP